MGDGADDALDYIEDCWEYNQRNPDDPENDPLAGWWGDEDELPGSVEEEDDNMEIEAGNASDIGWITALDRMCFGRRAAWRLKDFQEELARPGARLAIIGESAYILYRKWGRRFDITSIAVHPSRRHRGVGRALMEHVIGEAKHCDGFRMFLEVNCENGKAISLYEDLGFAVIGRLEDYYGEDDHAFEMMLMD